MLIDLRSLVARRLRHFTCDDDAVAGVEMTFIAPVMLAMFGLVVASQNSLSAWRKVVRTGHEITDLVSRSPFVLDPGVTAATELTQANLDADLALAQVVMFPQAIAGFQMTMSEVKLTVGSSIGTVMWSEGYNGATKLACGATVALDPNFSNAGATYLLIGQANFTFQPLGIVLNLAPIALSSTEILEIRNAQQIIVSNIQCP